MAEEDPASDHVIVRYEIVRRGRNCSIMASHIMSSYTALIAMADTEASFDLSCTKFEKLSLERQFHLQQLSHDSESTCVPLYPK